MTTQQQLDALKKWQDEWEPYFELVKQAIIEKYGASDPQAIAELNELELQFAKLRGIQAREATKRQGN